ncbi:hypothetical protein SBADM41S_03220 [Streptomyces badius]
MQPCCRSPEQCGCSGSFASLARQGLTGDAVAPFAQGVASQVQPLAVGAQARPFAGGLADTVREDARPAIGRDAAAGIRLRWDSSSFVTDAVPGR